MRRRRDPNLQRFLLEGERVVIDVRQHWGVIALPVVYTLAGLFAVMWVDARIRIDAGFLARLLWLVWFVLLGWLVFQVAQWRHDRFIATDKRLLLNYGLFTQKVAMMPLIKVTDMSYQRSVPGRLFGYGRFILESAGQDQALRRVDWVPHPDVTYRIICTEIFGVPSRERVTDPDRDDGYLDEGFGGSPGGPAAPVVSPLGDGDLSGMRSDSSGMRSDRSGMQSDRWAESSDMWSDSSVVDERWSYSQAIPLHQMGDASPMPSGEVIYSSDDERRRRRMADTGPIPQTPPGSDD
jgi:membrane protein YdbS with pleckstrin-like domain